ncbi:MAG: hypothetical protein AAGB31_05880 [Bdellovibrio sp.]
MDLSFKTSLSLSSWILLSTFSLTAGAETLYAPAYCSPKELTLSLRNPTSELQRAWVQKRVGDEIQEVSYDLAAGEKLLLWGVDFLQPAEAFTLKSWSAQGVKAEVQCGKTLKIPLTGTTSPQVTHLLPTGVREVRLHILNLFLQSNQIKLSAWNKLNKLVEQKTLSIKNSYDTETLSWSFSQDIARIEVHGAARLHSLLFYTLADNSEKFSPGVALQPLALNPSPEQKYFLVSTREARPEQAFIIALTDPEKIATARLQITNPLLEKIIVARITLGHGEVNRAMGAADKSPYSWSVSDVDAFADFAHIDCDGSPDLTEERLWQKMSEGGRICFWRYRIVRELSVEEVKTGRSPQSLHSSP